MGPPEQAPGPESLRLEKSYPRRQNDRSVARDLSGQESEQEAGTGPEADDSLAREREQQNLISSSLQKDKDHQSPTPQTTSSPQSPPGKPLSFSQTPLSSISTHKTPSSSPPSMSPPHIPPSPHPQILSDFPHLHRTHHTTGYRDGIAQGRHLTAQKGFDRGFSRGGGIGYRVGFVLGGLEYALLAEKGRESRGESVSLKKVVEVAKTELGMKGLIEDLGGELAVATSLEKEKEKEIGVMESESETDDPSERHASDFNTHLSSHPSQDDQTSTEKEQFTTPPSLPPQTTTTTTARWGPPGLYPTPAGDVEEALRRWEVFARGLEKSIRS